MTMTPAILAAAVQTTDGGGINIGTLLLFIGGAILLAFFCCIGVIARMRENRLEARRQEKRSAPTTQPPT
jgi:hypothetical protein